MSFEVLLIYANEMQPIKSSVFKALSPPKATHHSAVVTNDSVPASVRVVMNCAVLVKFARKKVNISRLISLLFSTVR